MTTRRFSRSLLEAFPGHYPHSIEHHKRPLSERVADYVLAVLIAVGIVALCLHSLGAL